MLKNTGKIYYDMVSRTTKKNRKPRFEEGPLPPPEVGPVHGGQQININEKKKVKRGTQKQKKGSRQWHVC